MSHRVHLATKLAFILTLAAADRAHASVDDACTRLIRHDAVAVEVTVTSDGILWNSKKVSHSGFDRYLLEETERPGPHAIFVIRWDQSKHLDEFEKITEVIRAKGLRVVTFQPGLRHVPRCPPIPF